MLLAMPRLRSPAVTTPDPYRIRASVIGGNGKIDPNERIARLERLIEEMQQALDTQFRRIAALQAEMDLMRAKQQMAPR